MRKSDIERFVTKVDFTDDCWLWTAAMSPRGYGNFWDGTWYPDGKSHNVSAHRWAYQYFVGPVPSGLVLDHLCHNRPCVRPEHMEAVTNKENLRRGIRPTRPNSLKTHCPRGHTYDAENTAIYGGKRYCRACDRAKARRAA